MQGVTENYVAFLSKPESSQLQCNHRLHVRLALCLKEPVRGRCTKLLLLKQSLSRHYA